MNKLGSRALVGALTVAMVAPSALAPVSQAVAAEAPAIERVTVDTSFSSAAQRIIKGEGRMTAEELKAAIDEAAKALDAAKADAERAEGADARRATVVATGEQANAQAAYDAVKDGEDTEAIEQAKAALDAANEKLGAAQTAYDDAVATAGAEAEAEADAAIAEKQQAADTAAAALADCKNKIATLPSKIKDIETQIASEQQKVTDAQAAKTQAEELVNQKQEAFDLAAAALEDLAEAQRQWDEKAKPLQEAVEAAKQGVADAKAALEQAKAKVADLKNQIEAKKVEIDRVQDQIDSGTTQVADRAGDLFMYITQTVENEFAVKDAAYAYNLLMNSDENLGVDKADTSLLENMQKALDIIDELNHVRELEGLDPVYVSSFNMANAMINSLYSTTHKGHNPDMLPTLSENLCYPGSYAIDGWYWDEKAYAGFKQETTDADYGLTLGEDFFYDASVGPKTDQTAYYTIETLENGSQVRHYVASNTSTVGHYFAVIDPAFHFVGGGYSTHGILSSNATQDYSSSIVLEYDRLNPHNDVTIQAYEWQGFTTDEYRQLIADCIEASKDADPALTEQLKQLKAKLAELEQRKAAAEREVASAQSGVTSANETLTQANNNLAAIGERPTEDGLQAAYDKAEQELNAAKQAQSDAQENLTNVTSEVNQKVEELDGRKSELEGQLTQAQGQLEDLRDASETAARELEETRAQYKSLTDAATALDAAQANATETDNAYETASALVKSLNSQIAELNGQIEAARADYDQKKAAAEAAGPTEEQTEALDDAEAALEAKRQQVAQLERDRDAAKNTADEAAAAKAAQSGDDLPQTGDAASAMIAGVVLAGMAAMGAGAHFRRRNQL